MKIVGVLLLLVVSSRARINKLFFSGPNIDIECPGEGVFFQWKRYHSGQMVNLLKDDRRTLNIQLKSELSPTTYECSGMNGFINYNENITIFVLDKKSIQAQKQCFIGTEIDQAIAQYPCFLSQPKESVIRILEGSSVNLNCEAGGMDVTYLWYRLNTVASHQEHMSQYNNIPVLSINEIDAKSAGQYLCAVNTTSGGHLGRYFDIQIIENEPTNSNMIFISGPAVTNISGKVQTNQKLTCEARAVASHKIHLIQWAKKVNPNSLNTDKNLMVKWGSGLYRMIPENQIQNSQYPASSVTSSLLINGISSDSAGHYVCAFFTSLGKMKHKIFSLNVEETSLADRSERSLLILYILIPSLVIAICVFVGIYLAISRIYVRKVSNAAITTETCCKFEKEAMKLRTMPDYSNSCTTPPSSQYFMKNNNNHRPHISGSDKLIV